ncbi:histone-lysine N-methyltransferase ASHR1-like [Herrania umbratica]|uniref:Histone-lysine N-methyltransferase ASHR1-like n=1 Tax=Herrania umbratica TaxID=108875 RepID=A0A6J1ABJ7_9ROSI|nr:histone-lysine N-methyltransferase ASHR1-like [Herrania umbratica]
MSSSKFDTAVRLLESPTFDSRWFFEFAKRKLIIKISCNAHAILDVDMEPLGTGLCLPNASLVFEGKLAVLRALLPVGKGDEVLISYIDLCQTTRDRRDDLNEKYHFVCSCRRCCKYDKIDDQILDALRCKHGKCDGFLVDKCGIYSRDLNLECSKCGHVRTSEVERRAKRKLEPLLAKAGFVVDYEGALSTYKKIEAATLDLFHPSSLPVMLVRYLLTKLHMETGDTQAALECCRLVTPVRERLLQRNDPVLGRHYYLRGRLEGLENFLCVSIIFNIMNMKRMFVYYRVKGNKEDGRDYLIRARDILEITHGPNFPLVRELLDCDRILGRLGQGTSGRP